MQSSATANAYDSHHFDQYVFRKILDLGFRVFGGSVRNRIWRSVNESDRKDQYGAEFFSRMFDRDYCPETYYNRLGGFADIDCIGTYEQYQQLSSPEMTKYGDLRYKISVKRIAYPIIGLVIREGELETFTVKVSSRIRSHRIHTVEVDMFVCKSENLENLYNILNDNLDFACNGLCMQKIGGVLTTSLMYHGSLERQLAIVNEIKRDEASLVQRSVTKSLYHRVTKMMAYGWFVEFDTLYVQNHDGYSHEVQHKLHLFVRSTDSSTCHICNRTRTSAYDTHFYVRVNGLTFHLDCYVGRSIRCYEAIQSARLQPVEEPADNDSVEQDIDDCTNPVLETQNSSLVLNEILQESQSNASLEAEYSDPVPPIIDQPDNNVESDMVTRLADIRLHVPNNAIAERPERIEIIGNVGFLNGIALELDEQDLVEIRRRFGEAGSEDDLLSVGEANAEIERYHLCSLSNQGETLNNLRDFLDYISSRYMIIHRM